MNSRIALTALGMLLLFRSAEPPAGAADDARVSYTLPSGLNVRLAPDARAKGVVVLLGARAGIGEEQAGQAHLAHVTEHLLAFGAAENSPEAAALERWFEAGKANGETTSSMMYFDLEVAPGELETALRLQAARLAGPAFTRERLAKEIPRTLEEVAHLERSEQIFTGKFACSAFVQAAYFGATRVPLKTKTKEFTVEDAQGFSARTFRPERAILCIAGQFDPQDARKQVEATFGKLRAAARKVEPERNLKAGRISTKWDVATRHLFLAWPIPPSTEREHAALALAAMLLGRSLLAEPGLLANTSFPSASTDMPGLFLVDFPVKPSADIAKVETQALEAIGRMKKTGPLADLLVTQIRAALLQVFEPVNLDRITLPPQVSREMALANMELQRIRLELEWGDVPAYLERLRAVDAAAVKAAMAKYLDPDKVTIVRLEPEK